jgi:hypothetical protein
MWHAHMAYYQIHYHFWSSVVISYQCGFQNLQKMNIPTPIDGGKL